MYMGISNGETLPVTGHGDPNDETSRFSHFLDNPATDAGEEDSWYSFLLEAESTPGP
jgi:hypothetical protein